MPPSFPGFKIFMVCENPKSFDRAIKLKETVADHCRGLFHVTANFCYFDWLKCPDLNGRAADSAAAANMIVFIAEESPLVPDQLQQWIKKLPASTSKRAFAVFTNPQMWAADAVPPLDHFVHSCAKAGQADFISNRNGQNGLFSPLSPVASTEADVRRNGLIEPQLPAIATHPRQSCGAI